MIDLIKLKERIHNRDIALSHIDVNKFKEKITTPHIIKCSENIYETTVEYTSSLLSQYLPKTNTLIFAKADDDFIWLGGRDFNISNLIKSNIKYSRVYKYGGTIVNFKGDLCVGFISREENNFGNDCMQWLCNYLNEQNLNASINGNDILLDDKYKVASWTCIKLSKYYITLIHVSIGMDLNFLKSICKKEMKKIPKGLSEFNITYDDIKSVIILKSNKTYIK